MHSNNSSNSTNHHIKSNNNKPAPASARVRALGRAAFQLETPEVAIESLDES